ncbi:MAG TPA: hypothetical protein VJ022_03240, partial [Anaerolineales bacterium]|nr:hypothetical protein [Anaerolineales bacterium]
GCTLCWAADHYDGLRIGRQKGHCLYPLMTAASKSGNSSKLLLLQRKVENGQRGSSEIKKAWYLSPITGK